MISRFGRSSLIQLDNMKSTTNENELQAILTEKSAEVCLLVDSPFRILRVRVKSSENLQISTGWWRRKPREFSLWSRKSRGKQFASKTKQTKKFYRKPFLKAFTKLIIDWGTVSCRFACNAIFSSWDWEAADERVVAASSREYKARISQKISSVAARLSCCSIRRGQQKIAEDKRTKFYFF